MTASVTGLPKERPVDSDAALDTLLELIATRRLSYDQAGQLDTETVEAMQHAGVYRALVPARFGGDERSPAQFLRLVERISEADGSAGWVASFGVSHLYLAALPEATLEALYAGGPDVVFAGALFPPQQAAIEGEGYRVSGRWSFGSGSPGASLIGVGIKAGEGPQGGLPRMAVMPATQARIVPNWDVIGLRGTGSHDIEVEDVFVPTEWTFVRGAPASIDLPIYRYPSMALAAQVLAVVGLGVGKAALDTLAATATARASITGAPLMAERAHVQIGIAKAEADLRAARAFFYEITEEVWSIVLAGEKPAREKIAMVRLASTNAARAGAQAARAAFSQAGTAGIYNANPLSRYLQNAAVVAQHAFLSEGTWQSAGQALLGLDTPPGFP